MKIIEKLAALLFLLIALTFFINHGLIDFSGVDFVVTKTKDALNSEEGKEITAELKDITVDVVGQLTGGLKESIGKLKAADELQAATLLSAIDGDTLWVEIDGDAIKVRLIGIDTPESVHPDEERNNEFGLLASSHTKQLLDGVETIYLEYDEEIEDQYGRLLAYVWLTDSHKISTTETIGNQMLNGMILRDGYAMNEVYPPNDKYASSFSILRKNAQDAEKGLWKEDGFAELWD